MRRTLVLVAIAAACTTSATALASGGYSVRVSTTLSVAIGQSFTVKASGSAAQKALLYVYLDHNSCKSTWVGEASRVGVYKAGRSYFLQKHGSHNAKETWIYAWVTGSFTKSFTAHAGATAEREHACAYLATPNSYGGYRVNAAFGARAYTVTSG
jgi:hypothetical protein